jgi:hypothetical protein
MLLHPSDPLDFGGDDYPAFYWNDFGGASMPALVRNSR